MNDPEVSMQTVATPSSPLTKLSQLYRGLGLLVWASLLAFVVALVVHHASRLPSRYTWLDPLRTLQVVFGMPGFIGVALATYCLGRWEFRGNFDVERATRAFTSQVEIRTLLPVIRRAVLGALLLFAFDSVVIGGERTFWDIAALLVLGGIAGINRPRSRRLMKLALYALLAALIFTSICYAYTVMKALALVHRTAVDARLIAIESWLFGAPPHRALAAWANTHPEFVQLCDWVYFRIFHHMTLVTVLLVGLRQARERTEYMGALAICYLLGGPLYHLWPGMGPGYFEPNFFPYLNDPALMTTSIRVWLQHNTAQVINGHATVLETWGYVSCMPSLHIAHELVMLYYARRSPIAAILSILFTGITLVAVVVLGWHYPIDLLGGLLVAMLAIFIARRSRNVLMPALLMDVSDEPIPARKAVIGPFLRALRSGRSRRS